MADQGGLSDALRRMAENEPAHAPAGDAELPQARAAGDTGAPGTGQAEGTRAAQDHADEGAGQAEDALMPADAPEPDHAFAAGSPAGATTPFPRPGARPAAHDHLKVAAVPLLGVVGALLLVPATWASLLLLGVEVPMARTPDAPIMAWVMLVCWPIALILLVSAVVIFRQLRRGH